MSENAEEQGMIDFYKTVDREFEYSVYSKAEDHPYYKDLSRYIEKYGLDKRKYLEIGSSKGVFQDLFDDYAGVDLSSDLKKYYHKPYIVVADERLPFEDSSSDVKITRPIHEHIPNLKNALTEILRCLRPGGFLYFAPAWHTRSWFAKEYSVLPLADLGVVDKLKKLMIPIRELRLMRFTYIFLRRIIHLIQYVLCTGRVNLKYKKLSPNVEKFLQSDSDACNSLDPFDMLFWFSSRGVLPIYQRSIVAKIAINTKGLVFRRKGCMQALIFLNALIPQLKIHAI